MSTETKTSTEHSSTSTTNDSLSSSSCTSSPTTKNQILLNYKRDEVQIKRFQQSVDDMKKGMVRNNHHTGDKTLGKALDKALGKASGPPCLHERVETWKYDQCADCKATLSKERLKVEKELASIAREVIVLAATSTQKKSTPLVFV